MPDRDPCRVERVRIRTRAVKLYFTCVSRCDDGSRMVCGVKHATIASARRCLRSALAPGIFRRYLGEIWQAEGAANKLSIAVVERYRSKERVVRRGRTIDITGRWVAYGAAELTPEDIRTFLAGGPAAPGGDHGTP